jgi:hypothetical protein
MFQIKKLINEEKEKLEEVFKTNPSPSARKRAHAILLNNMGFTVMQLTII